MEPLRWAAVKRDWVCTLSATNIRQFPTDISTLSQLPHTLLITTDAEIHYFLSVSSQHTHIPSRRWSPISITHLNFVLPLASLSPFLYRYNLFRDTAKTIVSGVNHSQLISISAVWVKKSPHITCLSVKSFKYVLGFLLVTALTSAVFQSDGWHLLKRRFHSRVKLCLYIID